MSSIGGYKILNDLQYISMLAFNNAIIPIKLI